MIRSTPYLACSVETSGPLFLFLRGCNHTVRTCPHQNATVEVTAEMHSALVDVSTATHDPLLAALALSEAETAVSAAIHYT